MANSDLSKELPHYPCPRLSAELIRFLDQAFPDRCPDLEEPVPQIYHKSGQRSVVRFLIRIFEEQNDNV